MAESREPAEFDPRVGLRGLWRRRGLVVLVTVGIVAAGLGFSFLQTPVYQGTVKVLLQPRPTQSLFDTQTQAQSEPARSVKDESEVIKSEPVRAAVRRRLGGTPKISVTQVGDTDVVSLKARSTSRDRAATVAKTYALSYIEFRRSQALGDLRAATSSLQGRIADLQTQIDALDKQVSSLASSQVSPALAQVNVAGLSARREQLLSQQALLKQRLDELQLDADLRSGGAQLITTTAVPTAKVAPRPLRTGVITLVLGLMLGTGLALLLDYLDDTIRVKDDVDRLAPELRVLGLIPAWRARPQPGVMTIEQPSSPAAESYRSLRTALQFIGVERAPRVFEVTSANSAEGKSSVVANLGVAMARAGQRVAMIDCDLRRAGLHQLFGLSNTMGFTSVFLGEVSTSAALQVVPGLKGLALLSSGPLPPNPSEVLSAKRTAEVFASVLAEYEIILVDCPPVLPVADAVAVSAWVDATLVVVKAKATTAKELRRSLELLRHAEAPIVGAVLNRVTPEGTYGYRYPYGEPVDHKARPEREPAGAPSTPPVVGTAEAAPAELAEEDGRHLSR